MNNEKTVILYGGAFDPPHNGHMHMANAATTQLEPDKLLWIPTAQPAHRGPAIANFAQRCDMINAAIKDQPNWELCTIENERDELSYFFRTLDLLIEKEGPAHFYVLIGQDQLDSFTEWDEWEHIVKHSTLLVMPRKGCNTTALPGTKNLIMLSADKLDVCSTDIRNGTKDMNEQAVPDCIKKYATQHSLYN